MYFGDTTLRYDYLSSMLVQHGAYDRRPGNSASPQPAHQFLGAGGGQRNKQTSGRLWVVEHIEHVVRQSDRQFQLAGAKVTIALRATRDESRARELLHARQEGDSLPLKLQADMAQVHHLRRVSQKPETCYIRTGIGPYLPHQPGSYRVQRHHGLDRLQQRVSGLNAALYRRADDARANRLGQHQQVSRTGAFLAQHPGRVNHARDGQPKLEFRVLNRVPPKQRHTSFIQSVQAPENYLPEHRDVHLFSGKAGHVHGCNRPAAHGVHIAQRVRGGNLPEGERVVHYGSNEVHCLDDGKVVGKTVNAGVIGTGKAHDHIRVILYGKPAQSLVKVTRTQLGSSARGVDSLSETQVFLLAQCSPLVAGYQAM